MTTEYLNEARKEIENRSIDFYKKLKEFYHGSENARAQLMEQTTQPFWQSLRLSMKRLSDRQLTVDMEMQEQSDVPQYDGPKKDGYDYSCQRTIPVKIKRTYYRNGKKIGHMKNKEIATTDFLKADVQGDMAVCPDCGHEEKLFSYIDGCDACGSRFLVSDFDTKVSGFALEEDLQQKSMDNYKKVAVSIAAVSIGLILMAILACAIVIALLALGMNGFTAVKSAAFMLLGLNLGPVFLQSLFYMFLIFIVMMIVMQFHIRPRFENEQMIKRLIPEFSTGDFVQNLEYQMRMIHLAQKGDQVQCFAACNLDKTVAQYQNVIDCCICGVKFLDVALVEDTYRIALDVKMRLTQDTGRRIRNRYEVIQLQLEGRKDVIGSNRKSLREYKCPNCGSSVDILENSICEYCNTAVDYRAFGWIITSYTNLGRPANPFAKTLAIALGIYAAVLLINLALFSVSESGKETREIWQSISSGTEYLRTLYSGIIYPDDIIDTCEETDSVENEFSINKTYTCEDKEAVKEAYYSTLLEKGYYPMQTYPTGFSVYKIERPDEEDEESMLFVVIRTEEASEGLTVTVTLMDENWEPLQE